MHGLFAAHSPSASTEASLDGLLSSDRPLALFLAVTRERVVPAEMVLCPLGGDDDVLGYFLANVSGHEKVTLAQLS
jgi:hypothetical protein